MADAAGAPEKEHGGGDAVGEDHGVMACTAGERAGWEAGGFERCGEVGGERGVHGDSGLVHGLRKLGSEVAALGYGLRPSDKGFYGGGADWVACVAEVEACLDCAGDYVGGVGFGENFAYGGDEAGSLVGVGFDCGDPLGGGGEGVMAEVHGGGSGVVGVACEGQRSTGLADYGGDGG